MAGEVKKEKRKEEPGKLLIIVSHGEEVVVLPLLIQTLDLKTEDNEKKDLPDKRTHLENLLLYLLEDWDIELLKRLSMISLARLAL